MDQAPFAPQPGQTDKMSATSTSSSITSNTVGPSLSIYNAGPHKVFVKIGTGAVTATKDVDYPIPPNAVIILSRPESAVTVAGVCDTGETATVYVTPGYGD